MIVSFRYRKNFPTDSGSIRDIFIARGRYKQMKQLTTWSHMVAGEYICGIEPGNANMLGRE